MTGPAGPGFDFTTASGVTGPVIPATGTYFVDVVFAAINNAPASGLTGECSVADIFSAASAFAGFTSAFVEPTGFAIPDENVSGILPVTEQVLAGRPPSISCVDSSGNPVAITDVQWYISSVQTSA
jgi:hypothetical protein